MSTSKISSYELSTIFKIKCEKKLIIWSLIEKTHLVDEVFPPP